MKRAFTLIELLVVIAIIAILAAILFPVFAQAKAAAKKTAALSQLKQVGTATNVYLADSDDTYPLDGCGNANGNIDTGSYAPYPAQWHPAFAGTQWDVRFSGSHWVNSTAPYIKNDQLLYVNGSNRSDAWGPATLYTDAARTKDAGKVTTTYNGYLHAYNASAVAAPSGLTLFWYGFGNQDSRGAGFSQPLLECFDKPTCQFNSGAVPSTGAGTNQTYMWGGSDTMDVFTGGSNFVMTDSSAKFRKLGIGRATAGGDWRLDPFATYNVAGNQAAGSKIGSGRAVWTRIANAASGVRYILHFMPDQDR